MGGSAVLDAGPQSEQIRAGKVNGGVLATRPGRSAGVVSRGRVDVTEPRGDKHLTARVGGDLVAEVSLNGASAEDACPRVCGRGGRIGGCGRTFGGPGKKAHGLGGAAPADRSPLRFREPYRNIPKSSPPCSDMK